MHSEKQNTLTIGILSFGNTATLENSIHSWKEGGLLEHADEVIIYFNRISRSDRNFAKKHQIKYLGTSKNLGISAGIRALIPKASCEYFLLLENDWELVEYKPTTLARIETGKVLLSESKANCIRYRHAKSFGAPLHTYQFKDEPLKSPEHLLDSVHYLKDPSIALSNYIDKKQINGENWFFASSEHANYTNNPCLYKTDFLKTILAKENTIKLSSKERNSVSSYAATRGLKPEQIEFESLIQCHWKSDHLTVAQGPGLFMHHPLGSSGSLNRLKRPPHKGMHLYDFIFSLGYGCSCSHHLRKAGLQGASLPYDWVLNNQSIHEMAEPFLNNFRRSFCKENLKKINNPELSEITHYEDTETHITSVHDFSPSGDFETEFEQFRSKHIRRAKRLIDKIEAVEKILIVYEDPKNRFESAEFQLFLEELDNHFPGKRINLLHIQYESGISDLLFEEVSSRIFFTKFNNTPDASPSDEAWTGNNANWSKLLSKFALNHVESTPGLPKKIKRSILKRLQKLHPRANKR